MSELDIKCISVENYLTSLSTQISNLLSICVQGADAIPSIQSCQLICKSVESFVQTSLQLLENDPLVSADVQETSAYLLASVHELASLSSLGQVSLANLSFYTSTIHNGVTKIFILADKVKIFHILERKNKVRELLNGLQGITHFSAFIDLFSLFGSEMVEFAHLTGDRQHDLKDEYGRCRLRLSRMVLEKSTMYLLTSSKTKLRHPSCNAAVDNCDLVFSYIRSALNDIENVLLYPDELLHHPNAAHLLQRVSIYIEQPLNAESANNLQKFQSDLVKVREVFLKYNSVINPNSVCAERFDTLATSLSLLTRKVSKGLFNDCSSEVSIVSSASYSLITTLRDCVANNDHFKSAADVYYLRLFREVAPPGDLKTVQSECAAFENHLIKLSQLCSLLSHVCIMTTDRLQAIHLSHYLCFTGNMVLRSAETYASFPDSKLAKENFDLFTDAWELEMQQFTALVREVTDNQNFQMEKRALMPSRENTALAQSSSDLLAAVNHLEEECSHWSKENPPDSLERAFNLCSMARVVAQFSQGDLHSTEELCTQFQFFVEESTKVLTCLKSFIDRCPNHSRRVNDFLTHLERFPVDLNSLAYCVNYISPASIPMIERCLLETGTILRSVTKSLCYMRSLSHQYAINTDSNDSWPISTLCSPGCLPDSIAKQSATSGTLRRLTTAFEHL